MMRTPDTKNPPLTRGILHNAAGYDFLMWLRHLGRERAFRKDVLRLAELACGDSVLDAGCGTGTLAILAKEQVGSPGSVYGIDASAEMIERAAAKARKRRVDVTFEQAAAEALPFPNARFDVVLSTIMLHHLPGTVRRLAVAEIRRVLKPGGRVLIVDFQVSGTRHGFSRHRHGHVKMDDMLAVLGDAGLKVTRTGQFGRSNLYFVTAARA